MERTFLRIPAAAALATLVAGCGSTIVTRETPPPAPGAPPKVALVTPGTSPSRASTLSGPELSRALVRWADTDSTRLSRAASLILQQAEARPVAGSGLEPGYALIAARLAWQSLIASGAAPADWQRTNRDALNTYNRALAAFIAPLSTGIASGSSFTVETPIGVQNVDVRFPDHDTYRPGYFDDLLIADRIKITGFRQRSAVGDFGVALVGERQRTDEREAELALQPPRTGVNAPLSAIARFPENDHAIIEILDPTETITAPVAGGHAAIAADFTAPLAISFGGINDLLLGLQGLLHAGRFESATGIYLTTPLDDRRIPVLLIHGLSSSPLVWRNIVAEAMIVPEIRRRFQFWYAYYPTGVPLVQSAATIRNSLADIRNHDDPHHASVASRNLVIVGYSMGGIIAQILSTDVGDRLWNALSRKPLDEVPLSPEEKAALRNIVFWHPVPGLRTVVFIATPHRGAQMVDMYFAQLGSRLVRLPGDILQFQMRVFRAIGDALDPGISPKEYSNGINSMSPRSPLFAALNDSPFAPGIRIYSIIGDRGRGDSPNSSDGVVPYWSTHLPAADEEIIVPTGHDAQTHPEAEREIVKALRETISR